SGNSYPSSWQTVGFVDFAGGNYQLAASSSYKGKGANGTDPGADIAALKTAGILNGTVTPTSPSTSALVIAGFPSSVAAGAASTFTITATDAYGNATTGYVGTVHFSSSDNQAVLPSDYTFTAADKGVHTFSATLKTAGTRSLTITDTATKSITGSQAAITVNPGAPGALNVNATPSSITAGHPAH